LPRPPTAAIFSVVLAGLKVLALFAEPILPRFAALTGGRESNDHRGQEGQSKVQGHLSSFAQSAIGLQQEKLQ
jgi:hypothetical protein